MASGCGQHVERSLKVIVRWGFLHCHGLILPDDTYCCECSFPSKG